MASRPDGRSISIHRSYTVDEASRALGVCKATIRRWMKAGLPFLNDQKPSLILGLELKEFLKRRKAPKQKCRLNEFYCLSCRTPRAPAYGLATVKSRRPATAQIRAVCETCSKPMHKRVSNAQLVELKRILRVRDRRAERHLTDSAQACPNVHLDDETESDGKESPQERAYKTPLRRISRRRQAYVAKDN